MILDNKVKDHIRFYLTIYELINSGHMNRSRAVGVSETSERRWNDHHLLIDQLQSSTGYLVI